MDSPCRTDSCWDGTFTWNQSPRQCLTRHSIMSIFATPHFVATALKVQLPLECAKLKCITFPPFQWVVLDESGWNCLGVLPCTLWCSMLAMASSRPSSDMLNAKNLMFATKGSSVIWPNDDQRCTISGCGSRRGVLCPPMLPVPLAVVADYPWNAALEGVWKHSKKVSFLCCARNF